MFFYVGLVIRQSSIIPPSYVRHTIVGLVVCTTVCLSSMSCSSFDTFSSMQEIRSSKIKMCLIVAVFVV